MSTQSHARRAAIITGARRGIGRSIAYRLAEEGYAVVLNDIIEDEAATETLAGIRARGGEAIFVRADISDIREHENLVDTAYHHFGGLDVLVNNAGIQVRERGDLLNVTPERFDEMIGVNLRGNFFLTQHAARRMLDDSPRPQRAIVIITSANATLVSPEKGEYCVSKSGLSMSAQLFAVRLAEAGIAVFEIRPGLIRTDMTAEVRDKYSTMIEAGLSPMRRWGEPDDIGDAVATLVSGRIPFATGTAIAIDGGLLIPRL